MQNVLSVGIEPTTLGLLDPRSNQLSYESLVVVGVTSENKFLIFQASLSRGMFFRIVPLFKLLVIAVLV